MSTPMAGQRKTVKLHFPSPKAILEQALARYKGIVNSSIKEPENKDNPYLESVDFVLSFKECKMKETGMSPSEYSTPGFIKAGVTAETKCYYLSLIRANTVAFQGKSQVDHYLMHHLAYPVNLKGKAQDKAKTMQDMHSSMLEFLVVYGIEWIEHAVQRQAQQHVKKNNAETENDISEIEKIANSIGEEKGESKRAKGKREGKREGNKGVVRSLQGDGKTPSSEPLQETRGGHNTPGTGDTGNDRHTKKKHGKRVPKHPDNGNSGSINIPVVPKDTK